MNKIPVLLLATLLLAALCHSSLFCSAATPVAQAMPKSITWTDGSEMVLVPAGEFLMGSTYKDIDVAFEESRRYWAVRKVRLPDENRDLLMREYPQSRVYVAAYYIDRYEVSNEQFDRFAKTTGYISEGPWESYYSPGKERYPVTAVTWSDALAYCEFVKKRLPTEAEWEKASRGTDGRVYPWGARFDKNRSNNGNMDLADLATLMVNIAGGRGTLPMGTFPDGASPYGVMDMAGSVCEWTGDSYSIYPYKEPVEENECKVSRGGSWASLDPSELRCPARPNFGKIMRQDTWGFRCVISVTKEKPQE